MFKTRIAIFKEQGQELIVVPLDSSFEDRLPSQRQETLRALQKLAINAGIKAPITIVWRIGNKRHFMAPNEWHVFLKTLKWSAIIANLCTVLACHEESNQMYLEGFERMNLE